MDCSLDSVVRSRLEVSYQGSELRNARPITPASPGGARPGLRGPGGSRTWPKTKASSPQCSRPSGLCSDTAMYEARPNPASRLMDV